MPRSKTVKAVAKRKTAKAAKLKAKPKTELIRKAKIISAGEDY
jgi:hypothetical protein